MNVEVRALSRYVKYARLIGMIFRKKPRLVVRVAHNMLRRIVLREKVVRKVEMGITFGCQCDCGKCSSQFMHHQNRAELTLGEIRKLAGEIIALGAIHINITGGEPLLCKSLFDIIACFQPYHTLITINTNGLLLDEDMIDRLERVGVDIIKISIDSPIAEEHDRSRGYAGCFTQAMKALAYIKKKKKILAQISTVCIKENLNSERIWTLVKIARDYNALLGLTIPAASGKWRGDATVLLENKEKAVLKKLIKIPHVIRDTDEAYLRSHCPAGSEEFYVTCYGDVIPCPLIQISFGNVKEENIRSIWARMNDFSGFKDKQKPGCLAGENREFIEKYLSPLKNQEHLPVSISDISLPHAGNIP